MKGAESALERAEGVAKRLKQATTEKSQVDLRRPVYARGACRSYKFHKFSPQVSPKRLHSNRQLYNAALASTKPPRLAPTRPTLE